MVWRETWQQRISAEIIKTRSWFIAFCRNFVWEQPPYNMSSGNVKCHRQLFAVQIYHILVSDLYWEPVSLEKFQLKSLLVGKFDVAIEGVRTKIWNPFKIQNIKTALKLITECPSLKQEWAFSQLILLLGIRSNNRTEVLKLSRSVKESLNAIPFRCWKQSKKLIVQVQEGDIVKQTPTWLTNTSFKDFQEIVNKTQPIEVLSSSEDDQVIEIPSGGSNSDPETERKGKASKRKKKRRKNRSSSIASDSSDDFIERARRRRRARSSSSSGLSSSRSRSRERRSKSLDRERKRSRSRRRSRSKKKTSKRKRSPSKKRKRKSRSRERRKRSIFA